MSVPAHLLAVDVKPEDFEWTPVPARPIPDPTPVLAKPAEPPPTTPALPKMKISASPISYDELRANIFEYHDALVRVPNWQVLLEAQNLAKKQARIAARRE